MSDGPKLDDEAGINEALKNVRSDAHDNNWAAVTYSDNKTLTLLGQGAGGVDELKPLLDNTKCVYALVRKTEVIDVSTTVKFGFIRFVGDNVPRMLRARLGTHSGAIAKIFEPYHVALDTEDSSEVTDAKLEDMIGFSSGTKVHVLDADTAASRGKAGGYGHSALQAGNKDPQPKTVASFTGSAAPSAPKQEAHVEADKPKPTPRANPKAAPGAAPSGGSAKTIKFADEDGLKAALADVRSDATETNWALVGYVGKKGDTLELLAKGNGGYSEIEPLLEDDMVGYALVRKTEQIDNSVTVKFAHLNWVGQNINRMHRARLGTYQGEIRELFTPFHVNLDGEDKVEFSDEIIEKAIAIASGKHSHILPGKDQ